MASTQTRRFQNPVSKARILVADSLNQNAVTILQEAGLEVDVKTGLPEGELLSIIGGYDGLIVRSATQVTEKVIGAGSRLQVIGRAGVGVDNIDLKAATRAGIIVQNTPLGNITSAAEHAIALLFAAARNITRADRDMKAGKWNKKGLDGVELSQKTLGIIGMGKVAAIVTKVAKALQMEIIAFDPYLTEKRAEELGVQKSNIEDLLARADFITIHSPLTPETKGLLNQERMALMKKDVRLVNCARGGIINEADLVEAMNGGRIAAAGLDVFEQEPLPRDSPLRALEQIILTPHLGASTAEAQERVAEDIAKQFVEFFRDGMIRNAVNVDITLEPKLAAYARLAETLGSMAAQMLSSPVTTLKVGSYGKLAQGETRELAICALKGLMARTTSGPVTLVNAQVLAESRGLELIEHKSEKATNYASLLVVAAETKDEECTLAGTCFDEKEGRIVRIKDFDVELRPSENLLVMLYPDRPGMVGKFGTILGESDINIANMAVGRREKQGQAVVALTLDDPVPETVLQRIRQTVHDAEIHMIRL